MIASKLTSKAPTAIPQPVSAALRVQAGDEIAYTIDGNCVILTKLRSPALDDSFATFNEWDGEADRRAYGKL